MCDNIHIGIQGTDSPFNSTMARLAWSELRNDLKTQHQIYDVQMTTRHGDIINNYYIQEKQQEINGQKTQKRKNGSMKNMKKKMKTKK